MGCAHHLIIGANILVGMAHPTERAHTQGQGRKQRADAQRQAGAETHGPVVEDHLVLALGHGHEPQQGVGIL